MKLFFIVLLCLLSFISEAQQLRIGVLRDYDVKRILFAYNDGSYAITGDSTDFGAILPNEFVDVIFKSNQKVELKKGVVSLGVFSKVILMETRAGFSILGSSRVDLQACKLEYSIVSPK